MKNALTLTIAFCLLCAATLGCKNNILSKIKEPKSKCAASLPKLDSAAEYAERGNRELTGDNYECAFDDCQKALDLDSENVDALLCRGYAYGKRRKYDLAEIDFSEAIRLAPDNPLTFSQRGQMYREIEQPRKALSDMNRAIELSPVYFYYERRGRIYADLGDYENAIKDYTEAIRQKPETAYFYEDRAKFYRKMGKLDSAEADERKNRELKAAKGN